MLHSLRAKLIFVVLLTTLLALVVALGAMVTYDVHQWRKAGISEIRTQADLLGQTVAPALSFGDRKSAAENLGLLRARPEIRAAAVYAADGSLFASYAQHGHTAPLPHSARPGPEQAERGDVLVFQPVAIGTEKLGTMHLRAHHDLSGRLFSFAGIALAVAAFAMLVALLFAAWLQRLVTRPILSISTIAREVVAQNDYSRRADKLSADEVGQLVESFNDMMAEIERHARESGEALQRVAHAREQIQQLNADLERRVDERTTQLLQSNEELARAIEIAEKANRAKSDFISSMSHELRTPLNAILGFGELLTLQGVDLPAAKRTAFAQHIVKAGKHLLNLINEILDLARIESAHMMLSLEPVALDDVLTECETMVAGAAQERSIRIVFPAPSGLGAVADRTRLRQVLLNLLSNAIKYNREGGLVSVDVQARPDGQRVRVAVRDTGHGLSETQLAGMFQPFNRLGQEAGTIEGTGIGLVVTKRLMELMGGSIAVESTPGLGTRFWIELQAADMAPATLPGALSPSRPRRSGGELTTLLHVEDNPANLRLVEEIVRLRGDHLHHIAAPDAHLGLQLARIHRPQVILLDLNLPGLSGHDALALLRADPQTAHIPVIAVTANAMPRDIARGLAAGFFRYVTKPISVAGLNEAIDAALAVP